LAALAWIDCQGELVEDLAEPVAGGDAGGDAVVAAAQVLYEGMTGREGIRAELWRFSPRIGRSLAFSRP